MLKTIIIAALAAVGVGSILTIINVEPIFIGWATATAYYAICTFPKKRNQHD